MTDPEYPLQAKSTHARDKYHDYLFELGTLNTIQGRIRSYFNLEALVIDRDRVYGCFKLGALTVEWLKFVSRAASTL